MIGFHARDGFYFRRMADGAVRITIAKPFAFGQFSRADGEDVIGDVVLSELILPENEWASVVASVCNRGETSETWQAARDYHAAP